jgi:hypothetical protein
MLEGISPFAASLKMTNRCQVVLEPTSPHRTTEDQLTERRENTPHHDSERAGRDKGMDIEFWGKGNNNFS